MKKYIYRRSEEQELKQRAIKSAERRERAFLAVVLGVSATLLVLTVNAIIELFMVR